MAKSQPKPAPEMIEPGQPAPDFALEDQKSHMHTLKGFRGQWVVLC